MRMPAFTLSILVALFQFMAGCSQPSTVVLDLGTNGTATLKLDGADRVRELCKRAPDGVAKVTGKMEYNGNRIASVVFFDERGERMAETVFEERSTSSGITDPKVQFQSDTSSSPAGREVYLTWTLDGEMLFRTVTTYNQSGRLKNREVFGPKGIPVVTNKWN
jgi:hypothetical protein